MSDQQTPDPQPTTDPTSEGTADPAASRRERFRARFARFREGPHRISRVIAVALASGLVVGGAGGFAVAAVTTDGPDRSGPPGRPFDEPHEDEQRGGVPPGAPGQLPPSTPPEDSGDLDG